MFLAGERPFRLCVLWPFQISRWFSVHENLCIKHTRCTATIRQFLWEMNVAVKCTKPRRREHNAHTHTKTHTHTRSSLQRPDSLFLCQSIHTSSVIILHHRHLLGSPFVSRQHAIQKILKASLSDHRTVWLYVWGKAWDAFLFFSFFFNKAEFRLLLLFDSH